MPKVNAENTSYPANIYLFKVTIRNTKKRCEIYLKLTLKILKRYIRRSGVFTDNFEHTSHLSGVSNGDF